MKKLLIYSLIVVCISAFIVSCSKEDNEGSFKNDFIKITVGPSIVGEVLEFHYALGTLSGKLSSAEAQASIEGSKGTGISRYSLYTDRNNGKNQLVLIAKDSITSGDRSTVQLVDTNAVTVRYFYVIPETARGKKVSFKFNGINSEGQNITIQTPEYTISNMDMKRNILLKNGGACYFSIETMTAYTKEEVDALGISNKIDFAYLYKTTMGVNNATFGHSIVSLANTDLLSGLAIPASWTKQLTLMEKRIDNMRDGQLKGAAPSVFIDDRDLEIPKFENALDFAITLSADHGALVQTANKTYSSYVYVNKVDNAKAEMTVSVKRLKLK